ncbi:MAG: hypothetical protein HY052_08720 [Proteobacteria bacterium]|nr:hypothetical protein [Pseudomonadota bacterium]
MKKAAYLALFVMVVSWSCLMGSGVEAQEVSPYYGASTQKPQPTESLYIAILFFKLSRQAPDFEAWARHTSEYQAAEKFDKLAVQDQQVEKLKGLYSLLTVQEPVIIETPVKLSAYSVVNKGFFIENFRNDTFFPVRYNENSYAIVPLGIMDRQWMPVPDESAAKAIESAAANKDKPLTMVLMLTPKYADNTTPAVVDDEKYWLISADVTKLMLYSPDSSLPLWQSNDARADDAKRQEILKLRQ